MTVDEAIETLQDLSSKGYGDVPLVDGHSIIIECIGIDEDDFDRVWVVNQKGYVMSNECIINPWIFYFIDLSTSIVVASTILAILSIILMVVCCVIYNETYDQKTKDTANMYGKNLGVAFIIFLVLAIFIPSRETCYKMLIASNITKENITTTSEAINEVLDKAVEKIIRIQKGRN